MLKKTIIYATELEENLWRHENSADAVFVDIYSDTCQPCKMFEASLERVAENFIKDIYLYKINADNDYNADFIVKNKVVAVPTIFLYKGNEKQDTIHGAINSIEIKKRLDKHFVL